MKRRFLLFCQAGAPFLLIAGIACSFVPWGGPGELHGEGFPVPSVIWDHANRYAEDPTIPDSEFLDFPNPLALILNPLLFLLSGLLVYLTLELIAKLFRRKGASGFQRHR